MKQPDDEFTTEPVTETPQDRAPLPWAIDAAQEFCKEHVDAMRYEQAWPALANLLQVIDDSRLLVTWELARYRAEHEGERSFEFFSEECYTEGFDIAFDIDTTPHQYTHVAYRYPSGALCGTKLLWGHGGPLTEAHLARVDCPLCLHIWEKRGLKVSGPEKDVD